MSYDAVVVAGGRGRRLGGVNKPALTIGGSRLLDIVLEATAGADRTIVVGESLPTARPVEWTIEVPAGGGPVAALAAALPLVRAATVVVLAADLPFLSRAAVETLLAAKGAAAAAIAVDETGRDQPLISCYDTASLRAALPPDSNGASMRALVRDLVGRLERICLGGDPPVTWDCDTAADLARARELA
jgi:molybdopterin-guanine dinucleotide biosynthesis protein A